MQYKQVGKFKLNTAFAVGVDNVILYLAVIKQLFIGFCFAIVNKARFITAEIYINCIVFEINKSFVRSPFFGVIVIVMNSTWIEEICV